MQCVIVRVAAAAALCAGPLGGIGAEGPGSAALVTIEQGDLPIILSAPHGGKEAIPGAAERMVGGAGKFVKLRDSGTDALALNLAEAIGRRMRARPYLVVARFHRKFADANRPPEGAYECAEAKAHYDAYHAALRGACAAVRQRWGRGLLIDVHGQGVDSGAIFRGTANGRTVRGLVKEFGLAAVTGPDSLAGWLEAGGYKILPPCGDATARESTFTGGHIVQAYSAEGSGVDAIQLEFGGQFRAPDRIGRTADDVAEAIEAFAGKFLPQPAAELAR